MRIQTLKKWLGMLGMAISIPTLAQDKPIAPPLTFSGYTELYYSYDFNKPINNTKPSFIYSHNRANEVNLNLGFLKAAYATEQIRANLAMGVGTYMNANYAAEPGVLKNIVEANIGVKLSKKNNLWLDAGILPSHIGFESAIGKDCWNLSRSMMADNSPYFETGVKVGYTSKNEQWYLAAMVLNGWQRIQRPDGNTTPAFGTQLTYKPTATITLNYSTFIGNDKPDSIRQMRYFNNFYGIVQLHKILFATIGFDIGAEQVAKGSSDFNIWYTPVLMVKIIPSAKSAIALRAEYYDDKNGVIISSPTANGFKTMGFSTNIDYAITQAVVLRAEWRTLNSKAPVFFKNNQAINNNSFVSAALAIAL